MGLYSVKILEKRKKSIKDRLIMDFGAILAGVCIFNYFLVSLIYYNMLHKGEAVKAEIIANAAITQAQLKIKDSIDIMDNITNLRYLRDSQITLEEKIKELEDYASPFYDIAVIELDGQGMSASGSSFNVAGEQVFEDAFQGKFNTFEIVHSKGTSYFVFIRPIKDLEEQLQSIVIGALRVSDFFQEIMTVSSGEVCFIANRLGTGIMGIKDNEGNVRIQLLDNDEGIKSLFKQELLYDKGYNTEIKDINSNKKFNFNYERINSSRWLLGIINNKRHIALDLANFRNAMITGMIIAISIGLIIVYFIANSIAKRMQHIASHLGDSIKNEFKDSVPMELLKNEDEIGTIAREMKYLEEEMADMLASIKDSINYLNDRVSQNQVKEEVDNEEIKDI